MADKKDAKCRNCTLGRQRCTASRAEGYIKCCPDCDHRPEEDQNEETPPHHPECLTLRVDREDCFCDCEVYDEMTFCREWDETTATVAEGTITARSQCGWPLPCRHHTPDSKGPRVTPTGEEA